MKEERLYQIYKIECNVNLNTGELLNEYIPIYIGCTCQSLKHRFSGHITGNSTLAPYIKEYGFEHFRIIKITTIFSNKYEAHKLEKEISLKYRDKYSLLNKRLGDEATEELNEKISCCLSKKRVQINDKIYDSVYLAAKALKIPSESLRSLLSGRVLECRLYKLDYVKDNLYVLKTIEKSTKSERIGKANQKKVKINLIEEKLTFYSMKDLAKYFNISRNNVQAFIRKGQTYIKNSKKPYTCCNKKILKIIQHKDYTEYFLINHEVYFFNMNNRDVSTSTNEALQLMGLPITENHIHECCSDINRSIKGNHFRYLTDEEIKLYKENKNNRFKFDCTPLYKYLQKHFVMNIEKGIIYKTAMDATRSVSNIAINGQSITNCCKGKSKSAYGYHWRYLTIEEIKNIMDKKIKRT